MVVGTSGLHRLSGGTNGSERRRGARDGLEHVGSCSRMHPETIPVGAYLVSRRSDIGHLERARAKDLMKGLMARADSRLAQEVAHLDGHFAQVDDEAIDPRHDDARTSSRTRSGSTSTRTSCTARD